MLLNFDNFNWGGPLEQGYGHVRNCTLNAGSIETAAVGDGEFGDGIYDGTPSTHRTGICEVVSDCTIAGASYTGLIEVWQGDRAVMVRRNGATGLDIWTVNDGVVFSDTGLVSGGGSNRVGLKWTMSSLTETNTLNADGAVELRVNNVAIGGASNLQLGFGLAQGYTRDVQWNVVVVNPHGTVSLYYLCDGAGSENNTWLGSGLAIYTAKAVPGNGKYYELTPSTGTDQGAMVDDTANDGDSSYLSCLGGAKKSSFNHEDFAAIGTKVVRGLKHVACGMKTESGFRRFRSFMVRNNLDQFAARDWNIGVGYHDWMAHVWEIDPYTNRRFTISNLNTTEVGVLIG